MDAELLLVQPYLLEEETGSSPCPGAEAAGGHGPPWTTLDDGKLLPLTAIIAIHATGD